MNVLSLFDGMSCGQIALQRLGFKVDKYFASEVDRHAIAVARHNFPKTMHVGDVCDLSAKDLPVIDLVIGGSPCQGFSFAGKQLNFEDPRSKLFFEFARLLDEVRAKNPNVKFLLENVRMKKEYLDVISDRLGVEPILIDSALLSGQHRKRYYWTNLDIDKIEDRGIVASSVIDKSEQTPNGDGWQRWWEKKKEFQLKKKYSCFLHENKKGITQTARQMSNWNGNLVMTDSGLPRFATPLECERLQTVPENYTAIASKTQRYKMLGNGWTIDVIAHILKNLN